MDKKLVEAVIYHAANHYEFEGWDILIECWSDEDIWSVIEGAADEKEAIILAAQALKPLNDHRMEIINAST
jgi:hypothetical protein